MIGIQSRKSKTAVFAGTSKQQTYKRVLSLEELCLNTMKDNYRDIYYLGNAPYYLIKPVLEKCNPAHLFRMEDYNPDLIAEDDELWEAHCKTDFKNKYPSEDESWRELYIRLKYERERKLDSITKLIEKRNKEKTDPARAIKLAFVDGEPKPPRGVKRAQEINGTKYDISGAKRLLKTSFTSLSSSTKVGESSSTKRPNLSSSTPAPKKVKKTAPLMRKTLDMMKSRFRR